MYMQYIQMLSNKCTCDISEANVQWKCCLIQVVLHKELKSLLQQQKYASLNYWSASA